MIFETLSMIWLSSNAFCTFFFARDSLFLRCKVTSRTFEHLYSILFGFSVVTYSETKLKVGQFIDVITTGSFKAPASSCLRFDFKFECFVVVVFL